MHPQPSFCPNLDCPSRGEIAAGNLRVHDSLRNRWKCRTCGTTFSGRKGTPFYNLKTDPQIVVWAIALLAYGCPPQAIVAAFGLDERTVASWQQRAGAHCQAVHTDIVQTPQPLTCVQADEIRVRCQKRLVVWLALARCATTRLWLGGVASVHRDKHLARSVAQQVKACAQRAGLAGNYRRWARLQGSVPADLSLVCPDRQAGAARAWWRGSASYWRRRSNGRKPDAHWAFASVISPGTSVRSRLCCLGGRSWQRRISNGLMRPFGSVWGACVGERAFAALGGERTDGHVSGRNSLQLLYAAPEFDPQQAGAHSRDGSRIERAYLECGRVAGLSCCSAALCRSQTAGTSARQIAKSVVKGANIIVTV